ncbi:MAG TPA: MBL fold metallo-hydrolase [Verrucomicrobiae bacterium]|nr:MBL fold metallo-hydrolase [Verrucomicrobiae bacterium]
MPLPAKNLYLKQLLVGPMDNFIYLIGDKKKGECVMVDPAWDVPAVLKIADSDEMKVTGALLTHTHYDHCNGAETFLEKTGGRLYVNKNEAPFMKGMRSDVVKVDSGHQLKVGDFTITFIHTPGHTPGSQCFMIEDHLVSGDTLFINACGRCDLPGGNAEQMYSSLQTLGRLPEHVILLPGHHYDRDPTSTIGKEKRENPYYQANSLQEFLEDRMG